jgi:hypothetical protein
MTQPLARKSLSLGEGGLAIVFSAATLLSLVAAATFCDADAQAAVVARQDPEASAIAAAYGDERYVFSIRQSIRPDSAATIAT